MRWVFSVLAISLACSAAANLFAAQAPPPKNPLEGNADAIRGGMGLYRARCADCHGMDARGVRAPDITQVWASGRTDAGLFKTIKEGVPGTGSRSTRGVRVAEAWQFLASLRPLAAPAPTDPPRGDAVNGERIFRANCAVCHRVKGAGGRLGPDLSRIGIARSREAVLRRIRRGAEGFGSGYEPVTLTPPSGQPIQGVKKNEDLFSVQIMDTRERIQGFEKDKMKSVKNDTQSAMPIFGPDRLNDSDLDDLLRYLGTLRGFDPAVAP